MADPAIRQIIIDMRKQKVPWPEISDKVGYCIRQCQRIEKD